uniref:Uncharacterized protein n=1 Tax=Rhizophora mucronata TaxID=61149 RepID=A0A2P2PCJ0_RHIMU
MTHSKNLKELNVLRRSLPQVCFHASTVLFS